MPPIRAGPDEQPREVFGPAIRVLAARTPLPPEVAEPLIAASALLQRLPPGEELAPCEGPRLVVEGWLAEARRLRDGRRQIFDFLLPGDVCFLTARAHPPFTPIAITPVAALDLRQALRAGYSAPEVEALLQAGRAAGEARRIQAAARLGVLSPAERLVDLLEDLAVRLRGTGLADESGFCLPLTPIQLADALGLSSAQLAGTLTQLRRAGRLELRSGRVRLT